jgi:hypothetical protein
VNDLAWEDSARDELADIWVGATPQVRNIIEAQILQLERDLIADPLAVGESRSGTRRVVVLLPLPLVISFRVHGNHVRIVGILRPRKR